ncbi:MAG TPA: protein translocase subunit SecD [Candidatus Marinimicrobia bacterium]|jgi:preprotein translocase subunit SecD|nr:protein translocase subunit SecD [Candidatus Neomarinimicrobiota bacterium]MDP7122294.1 protein translocase subunit SecD [Candidatus Neomarinimicrobiota bacterium]HJL84683.1 protein translocase subunit SecD [Candidatus Neomarinimicrobiota bacterium]HJM11507.1 protein translocase subunit SecD [Candidatus Neomarinimicrobiota bacterium]HJM85678.1 protein translocase subunit SecD [Candidatus Neomarinimicrobiota bacterium]
MFGKNTPRLIVIGVVLLWALYALFPTIKYNTLSGNEKTSMEEEGILEQLEKKTIRRGLDLQGGMHIVLEVDIPTLVENLASNKNNRFYEVFDKVKTGDEMSAEDFINQFATEAKSQDLRLNRYYMDYGSDPVSIQAALEDEATDAINRALEILQNRIDEFGVSEPTIQKQGNRRVIVELAGIQDPERARSLLQSTALLEFALLKDGAVTQNLLTRVDRILKGSDDLEDLLETKEDSTNEEQTPIETETRVTDEEEVSLTELFGTTEEDTTAEDTTEVLVDKDLFEERPFSSLLRQIGNDLGVPEQNMRAVTKIMEMSNIQDILKGGEGRLSMSKEKDTWTLPEGGSESFYRMYHLEAEAGLTGGVIEEALATLYNGQPIVTLSMNSEGAKTWSRMTGANVGRRLAILLDGNVHMAPVIRTKISDGQTQVEGFANMNEAKDIAIVLRAGALPAPVDIIEERTVGPSLGQDSIDQGTQSIIIGLVLVLAFMVFYYRGAGLIASFAVLWNLILVLSILAMLKATLTLPGIAGLILTVGMAVDANVIIFERIREELGKGKTPRSAIDSGYSRAITTIVDANVTTILAALVLMQFGTGPIRGFAVVLFWGIATSMFTAIFTTRTIFNLISAKRDLKTLSI